jgi:tetratricopeptide (TPR) repeat protein
MRRLALAFFLVWVLAAPALARPGLPVVSTYMYNPKLDEFQRLVSDGKYVKAREIADQVFAQNPEDFQAWYLMGEAMVYCEGNLPRAWFYFTGARSRLEKAYHGEDIPEDGPWRLHGELLVEMADTAGQMEMFDQELELLETRDRLYKPPRTWAYGWPLMKLGRYEEARAKIAQALRERPNDMWTVLGAYNSLGAVEGEMEHIEEAYKVFLKLIDICKARHWDLEATYFYNASEQAMELHRFHDEERLLIEGTKYFDPHSYTNPWTALAALYIGEARLGEALAAIRQMHDWSHRTEPRIEQQNWNEQQLTTAAALLVAGYDLDALALTRRTLNRPDRKGTNSMKQDQTEIGNLVFYRELLKTEAERYNEHLSWCSWGEWLKLESARVENQREQWAVTSRAASVIVSNDRLDWALRPYAVDSRILEWYRGAIHEILGEGVTSVAIKKLLERGDATADREKPYLLAELGEADLSRGYPARAIDSLSAALKSLPEEEALLRARVTALLAQAYQRQGDTPQAMTCYRQVMERAPQMLRELGIALPVAIENDGSPIASTAAGWLHRSPRFDDVGAGFVVRISTGAEGATALLLSPDGTMFANVTVPIQPDVKATARALCQELHNKAFMVKLDLSQTDINSLDGSNMTGASNRSKLLKTFGLPTDDDKKDSTKGE